MWFTTLLSFASGLISPITQLIKNAGDRAQAAHDLKMAEINAQIESLKTTTQFDYQTLVAQLGATTSNFKDITLFLVMLPVVITCIWPEKGKAIFDNLALIPQYYQYLILSIYGTVWGIKNVVLPMSNNSIKKALINRQQVFSDLKAKMGPISQPVVDAVDAVIDDIEQTEKQQ